MVVRRIISNEQKEKISGFKVYKGKSFLNLSQTEKDKLLEILAKKAGIL